jgi:hypothetical protein
LTYEAVENKSLKSWRNVAFRCIIEAVSNAFVFHSTIKTKKLSTPMFHVCYNLVLSVNDLFGGESSSSSEIACLHQKHLTDSVPLPEEKKRAQRRCICVVISRNTTVSQAGPKDSARVLIKLLNFCCSLFQNTTLSKKYPTLGQEKKVAYLEGLNF